MLSKFSWSSFIWILVLLLSFYYFIVLVLYFRKDLFFLIGGNRNIKSKSSNESSSMNFSNSGSAKNKSDESFTVVHELLEDLKELFASAAKVKMVKEELIQAIHGKLKSYPKLEEAELSEDLNLHIKLEVRETCGIELLPEDFKQVWRS
jgi:hypothetical protein